MNTEPPPPTLTPILNSQFESKKEKKEKTKNEKRKEGLLRASIKRKKEKKRGTFNIWYILPGRSLTLASIPEVP